MFKLLFGWKLCLHFVRVKRRSQPASRRWRWVPAVTAAMGSRRDSDYCCVAAAANAVWYAFNGSRCPNTFYLYASLLLLMLSALLPTEHHTLVYEYTFLSFFYSRFYFVCAEVSLSHANNFWERVYSWSISKWCTTQIERLSSGEITSNVFRIHFGNESELRYLVGFVPSPAPTADIYPYEKWKNKVQIQPD